ncbi:MAG: hypothetical protein ACR2M9_04555 [Cyanophyceae cyanobacterium]
MADFDKAVRALYSNVTVINGDTAYDAEGNEVSINMSQVNAWTDPNEYKDKRQVEYPDIGDQLDDLFHAGAFSTQMTAQIQAVKDKHPKD